MTRQFRTALLASAASLAAIAGMAGGAAADETRALGGVKTLHVEDFIGAIEVRIDDSREASATLSDAETAFPVDISTTGGAATIKGDKQAMRKWWKRVDLRHDREHAFDNFLAKYPTLTVTLPRALSLELDNVVTRANIGDLDGPFSMNGGHVTGAIGSVLSADVEIDSSADFAIGAVARRAGAKINGSGDLKIASTRDADISINGSGDVTVGPIAGDAEVSINGSGDVSTDDIAGPARLAIQGSGDIMLKRIGGKIDIGINGSGDVTAREVAGGADIDVSGSGDTVLNSIDGPVKIGIDGSGDVSLRGGRADGFRVRTNGSGDVTFDGVAVNPDIAAYGSSSVRVREAKGDVTVTGHTRVYIGDRTYNND